MNDIILTPEQAAGLNLAVKRYRDKKPYTCISGYAGTGKAQPNNTIIPTPNGPKQLGDIKSGDYVFDRYGKPTKVLNVFPQGVIDNYKVSFKDGRFSYCNNEHIWTVIDKHNRSSQRTTQQLIDSGLTNSAGFKYSIPANAPAEYPERDFSIHPYVIGAFLGDGCNLQTVLTLSSQTEEIPLIVGSLIRASPIKSSADNYNWTFKWDETHYTMGVVYNGGIRQYEQNCPQTASFFADVKDYLIQKSEDKRIPPEYKYSSIDQRLALVQGLMDTDGSITENGGRYNVRFTSISKYLIDDLREVLWSLGYESTITIDQRVEKYTTNICYGLNINMPNAEKYKIFRLQRKLNLALKAKDVRQNRLYNKISIVDIQPTGEKVEMTCLYVDNPEHLYLTNDYIVTHNTTLVRFIIEALGIAPRDVCFVAYTGKAALVLQEKGNLNAKTTHRLLYQSYPRKDGTFFHMPRRPLEYPYKIIVVDEVSMLPRDMWELLLSHRIHVLALGDPGQLPSLSEDNGVLAHPHIFLDKIMRQAQESEIIRVSMDIRAGKPLQKMNGKEVQIIDKSDLVSGMLKWADQIIVAKNQTRHYYNDLMRTYIFGEHSKEPMEGDKVICLRNDWDCITPNGDVLVNGLTGYLENINYSPNNRTNFISNKIIDTFMTADFIPDHYDSESEAVYTGDGVFEDISMDYKLFTTWEPSINRDNFKRVPQSLKPHEFDYGYVITCHKSQGSEYKKVLVFEEDFPRGEEHIRWLYTAVTRAQEKLVIVRR